MSALAALPAPAAAVPGGKPRLSRKAKAAIIVQFLLNEGADVPLSALPDEYQAELTMLLGNMRYVDRETLNAVVEEFSNELESVGLSFPGDMAGALSALDGKINPHTAMRLRKEAGVRQTGDPWARINALDIDRIKDLVMSESTEIAAVMMSKIDVGKAAQVLAKLPGDKARRISYAVSMTTGVTPDAVDRIGLSLAAQVDAEPPKAFKARPDERLGAILNYSNTNVREELLQNLEQEDAVFAEAVRKAIFTFANIPERLNPIDVPKITRDVAPDMLAMAMAAAGNGAPEEQKAVEFLYDNMSKRLGENIREEAAALGEVKAKPGERAMAAVVGAIRDLVSVGEIELVNPDEE
ncbi:FliG C-terminal domain-containing protein [Mameliella sediminis]|uniref:FliG C-terminal domain-containing protein n=1 Tax=Mameliella sediminis TaxID=2836866 RepID=UPI001C43CE15|nr:FliG C-terminal domain-containing protein [Mameliella sediminis]MBY6116412.1 flagellar motor switch protein FliG [Antarctobacter heliothermus]MBY6145562.1 flagellar motor switch protein FliG [Mameliella alba]MBV7393714.1 flagellar motor switch protein FliG [Mameliella sediminis]MBY6160886.1 flagellar motor switch protein FliG [Mameliella alba]MBY6169356.1 flagellar motor switch protein FliG [Mameliella alba]